MTTVSAGLAPPRVPLGSRLMSSSQRPISATRFGVESVTGIARMYYQSSFLLPVSSSSASSSSSDLSSSTSLVIKALSSILHIK